MGGVLFYFRELPAESRDETDDWGREPNLQFLSWEEWRRTVESFCSRHGMCYVPIDTNQPLESLLFDVLRRRGVVR